MAKKSLKIACYVIIRSLGRGGRMKILLCLLLFLKIFCFLSSPRGAPSPGEASEQGAQWSSSCAHAHGALSHHSVLYNLWPSLDPQPLPWPHRNRCCALFHHCTAARNPSLAFGVGEKRPHCCWRLGPSGDITISCFYWHLLVSSGLVGSVFKITVSPRSPYPASGADSSGAAVWAVGSHKSPWWLCPSLGILCSDWEPGVSVARSWVRAVGCAAGGQGWVSKHGFLTGARLQCSQLLQSLPSSHTRRRQGKTGTESTEFQSHVYAENMCMHEEMNWRH